MADILLAHCNHLYFDKKQARKMQPYPPLQTLLAAGCLRRDGFDVALFDSTLEYSDESFRRQLDRHRPKLVVLCEDNFNFLTKMCLTRNRELAFFMSQTAKEAGLPVVVNSSDAAGKIADYLLHGADFVILGEVELALLETARHILRSPADEPGAIAGLAYRDPLTNKLRINPPREPMRDLDLLPLPAWDLIDAAAYRNAWIAAHGYFSLNMVSSRGCPYRCNWCSKPIYGDSYHFRSPESVAQEMRFLKDTLDPDHIWFADDIFALSSQWTMRFAEAVEALDARIPFKMQSRCDLMTRGTVDALRRAGCAEVWMGAESGSQKVLDAMEKGTHAGQVDTACENLRLHGIRTGLFLQFGYPGETWEDIQSTIRMVRRTRPDDIGISVAYPLPGTKFYNLVEAQLGAKKNWEDSDDLAMMFQGAYRSDFYRALRDVLHREVAWRNHGAIENEIASELNDMWRQVEAFEQTSAAPNPTPLWTCC
jgi:anaerobic magnesium-protoporphyrin IX monomethyl ester cyclase